jgi:hypothetical protein
MNNKGKQKSFKISDYNKHIAASWCIYIGACAELASDPILSSVHAKHNCEEP